MHQNTTGLLRRATSATLILATLVLGACSDSGGGGGGGGGNGGGGGGGGGPVDPNCAGKEEYASTYEAVQKRVFEGGGCTSDVCHGSSKQGGLQLTADVAYRSIFERPSTESTLKLIEPGDNDRSWLWMKLAANTKPGSVQISGSPMPLGRAAISEQDLELLSLWIYAGAPETGTVRGTEELLGACLPPVEPITIKPLEAPAADVGVQFVLPEWDLPAASEHELCMATYYDITDQVPREFQDPSGQMFRFYAFELLQDPQSHHLLLYYSPLNFQPGGIDPHDPSFGAWTCHGGANDGGSCEPTERNSCGAEGVCASAAEPSFACSGYGPPSPGRPAEIMGGAGQAQAYLPFREGVFSQIPMKGLIYWNTHAFNTTAKDTKMHGRINYIYAKEQRYPVSRISVFDAIFKPNNPPFTVEPFCNDTVFPVGSRIFHLFAHMHSHGKHFWANLPADGPQIYETFSYQDPTQQYYDPPLELDSPDPKQRTIRYCGVYNNGVNEDGSFNVEKVTRASRVPTSAQQSLGRCKPTACVNDGAVGLACNGKNDNATCDTSPGAGDGLCDACRITGGESTQNEMFVLFGAMYIDPVAAAKAQGIELPASAVPQRSMVTDPIFPAYQGCTSPDRGLPEMLAARGASTGGAKPAKGSCHSAPSTAG